MFDWIEIVVINNCVVLMAICLLIVWCLYYKTLKKKKRPTQESYLYFEFLFKDVFGIVF